MTSDALNSGKHVQTQKSWWSPTITADEAEEKEQVSPVKGVVESCALLMLPPPREVARPEIQRNSLPAGNLDEEEWVTVYGFHPGDTNLVLREFNKYGIVLKHVTGPSNTNWMHILYQSRSNTRKSLNKNGMQIKVDLIVGVKPIDRAQCQAHDERLRNQGFLPLPPITCHTFDVIPRRSSSDQVATPVLVNLGMPSH